MGAIFAAKKLSENGVKMPGAVGLASSGNLPTGGAFGLLSQATKRDKKSKKKEPALESIEKESSKSLISGEGL